MILENEKGITAEVPTVQIFKENTALVDKLVKKYVDLTKREEKG